jgi:hypothetical protein
MMRATTTMLPSRDIPQLYPACPSCGSALRALCGPFRERAVSRNSRPSAAGIAAFGSPNQPTSIPRGISPRARNCLFAGLAPTSPTPSAPPSRARGLLFARAAAGRGERYQKVFSLFALPSTYFKRKFENGDWGNDASIGIHSRTYFKDRGAAVRRTRL